MEITVGAQFKKVGTEDIVTVIKHDNVRGTVVVKFPSGRSIPMSTGSLMKAEKWEYLGEDDTVAEETETENKKEKPKKEKKKKTVAKMWSKKKIIETIGDIITNAMCDCEEWDSVDFDKTDKTKLEWVIYSYDEAKIKVTYSVSEKQFNIYLTDDIVEYIKDTEFNDTGIINTDVIEDKLTKLLNTIVEKVNNKESEEQANG